MKLDWKRLLLCRAIPWGVGGLAALLTGGGMGEYSNFIKPPYSPPGWLFPVVWTILYLLMGYSCYRVLVSGAEETTVHNALSLYAIQLVLNFFRPDSTEAVRMVVPVLLPPVAPDSPGNGVVFHPVAQIGNRNFFKPVVLHHIQKALLQLALPPG